MSSAVHFDSSAAIIPLTCYIVVHFLSSRLKINFLERLLKRIYFLAEYLPLICVQSKQICRVRIPT